MTRNDGGLPILVTAMLLRDDKGNVLLAQRLNPPEVAGMWELPGGKLDPGESPEECLAREIYEELGVEVSVGELHGVSYHVYSNGQSVLILCYKCTGEFVDKTLGLEGQAVRWFDPRELPELPLVPADIPLLRRIDQ